MHEMEESDVDMWESRCEKARGTEQEALLTVQ